MPARLAKARAALEAAERQRDFTARQLALCEVRAPVAGVGHARAVAGRRGIPHGPRGRHAVPQPGFPVPARSPEHVVRGYVGEAELPWVKPGHAVEAVPAAFPHVRLSGRVESVGRHGPDPPRAARVAQVFSRADRAGSHSGADAHRHFRQRRNRRRRSGPTPWFCRARPSNGAETEAWVRRWTGGGSRKWPSRPAWPMRARGDRVGLGRRRPGAAALSHEETRVRRVDRVADGPARAGLGSSAWRWACLP
jgi:hypothetical protein